jgi:hypothetical protein
MRRCWLLRTAFDGLVLLVPGRRNRVSRWVDGVWRLLF